jgi:ABC-2 type transport system permease protein
MSEAPTKNMRPAPGVPVIPMVNWGGLRALYIKEVRRFFKVHLQTIWAPAITTLLYLVIFTVALGRGGRTVMGTSFADFIAPGLIVSTGMMQSAFANASFSLLVGKIQGTIVDYLMPPLSAAELLAGLVGASMTRAILVGTAIWGAMWLWPGITHVPRHLWAVLWFGLNGAALLSFIGVLASIWAEKFDHNAAVTNFIIQPASLLSGTFYSVNDLHGFFRTLSHMNPIFHVISGFRYGFLGVADSNVALGALVLLAINSALGVLCYVLILRGWKLRS